MSTVTPAAMITDTKSVAPSGCESAPASDTPARERAGAVLSTRLLPST
jgi:hypothetical protein